MNDPRQAAIERAVRSVALKLFNREQTVAEAVGLLAAAVGVVDEITPREIAGAVSASRRAEMIAELERHERAGRKRSAVPLVARKYASDPRDPVEVESLERKLRRWRQKNFGQCPSTANRNE